ncbi:MAG TPA: hypothetical protein PKC55_07520 [Dysgonomonas sp.]|uniref:hypothetical protein n=1 Tax=unclassified Dysgonomonas TaxID=2630389 RepID=UPI0025BE7F1D|nr:MULTISPECIES: hypothetical protein [unclassified Dysgonomonas]HML64661.1 hypothetical protein [Dysgonomonas sp.]
MRKLILSVPVFEVINVSMLCIGDKFEFDFDDDKELNIYMGIHTYDRIDYIIYKSHKTGTPKIRQLSDVKIVSRKTTL